MTDGRRAEECCQAAERAEERVQAYFDARAEKQSDVPNQHDIDGIKQLIWDAALTMKKAAEGKAWAQKARDPATYLAERIVSMAEAPQISHTKRAEYRFALEMLADEMGVKDEMLKVLAARYRQPSR